MTGANAADATRSTRASCSSRRACAARCVRLAADGARDPRLPPVSAGARARARRAPAPRARCSRRRSSSRAASSCSSPATARCACSWSNAPTTLGAARDGAMGRERTSRRWPDDATLADARRRRRARRASCSRSIPRTPARSTRASSRSKPDRSRRLIEHYLATSEQLASRLVLAASDGDAGGRPAAAPAGVRPTTTTRRGRASTRRIDALDADAARSAAATPTDALARCFARATTCACSRPRRVALRVLVLARARRERAAHRGPRRDRGDPRRARRRRGDLRVLQPALHVRARRGARAVRARAADRR